MLIRKAISLRLPRTATGREKLENAAKIKVIVYPCRSDLRNSFFTPLWKPMTARRIAAGRKENIKYSPRVLRGLPHPEEYFSRKIPITPRSIKKIKRAILIFLGKNFSFIKSFPVKSFSFLSPVPAEQFGYFRIILPDGTIKRSNAIFIFRVDFRAICNQKLDYFFVSFYCRPM